MYLSFLKILIATPKFHPLVLSMGLLFLCLFVSLSDKTAKQNKGR